jgi:hypothetical protein
MARKPHARSERPATGMGSPSRKVAQKGTQVENLCYERRTTRRPPPVGFHSPAGIGYPVNR